MKKQKSLTIEQKLGLSCIETHLKYLHTSNNNSQQLRRCDYIENILKIPHGLVLEIAKKCCQEYTNKSYNTSDNLRKALNIAFHYSFN